MPGNPGFLQVRTIYHPCQHTDRTPLPGKSGDLTSILDNMEDMYILYMYMYKLAAYSRVHAYIP